jgi:hypothetical protein
MVRSFRVFIASLFWSTLFYQQSGILQFPAQQIVAANQIQIVFHPECLLLSYDTKKKDMGKSTNFSGQPIFNQLLKFIDKSEIRKIAKKHDAERYVKKFTTYHHVVVMLFVSIEGYHSLRETILGLAGQCT